MIVSRNRVQAIFVGVDASAIAYMPTNSGIEPLSATRLAKGKMNSVLAINSYATE